MCLTRVSLAIETPLNCPLTRDTARIALDILLESVLLQLKGCMLAVAFLRSSQPVTSILCKRLITGHLSLSKLLIE